MRVKSVLPKELYKALGGYTPMFFELNRKIGHVHTAVLMVIIDKMKVPGEYVDIKTAHIAGNLGVSWKKVNPVIQDLSNKGLINIQYRKGGKHSSKRYRADLIALGALFDLPEKAPETDIRLARREINVSPEGNQCSPLGKSKQSLQSSVERKKNTPSSYLDVYDDSESHQDRRTRIWEEHLESHDPTFMQKMLNYICINTNRDDFDMRTVRYVTYFVLSEQWLRNKRKAYPKNVEDFVEWADAFMEHRLVKVEHMWEYDLLAAQIADKVGICRNVDLSTIEQYDEAGRFSRLYSALCMSTHIPDMKIHSYLNFLEEYVNKWSGRPFKFSFCASDITIEVYDAEQQEATGKETIMGYFNATY